MSLYWQHSRSTYYGVLCAFPLLALYEALLWIVGPTQGMQVRNAADVWLRLVLESLGLGPRIATLVMMGLLGAAVPLLRRGEVRLRGRYLLLMLTEAVVYSLALGILINLMLYGLFVAWMSVTASLTGAVPLAASVVPLPASAVAPWGLPWDALWRALPLAEPAARDTLTGIALSLGAGLFEEFAFRVVLLAVLLYLFGLILRPGWAAVLAIPLAALLFALAHYGGSLGEPFSLHTLAFRWLAGLLFTLLYYTRGFAITAYAHALYDIWVLMV